MVFILVQPGRPLFVKAYDEADTKSFPDAVREMLGGSVVVCHPFKSAPEVCLAIREGHSRLGLPANRELRGKDGKSQILFGSFVLFAMSKEEGVRDLTLIERKMMGNFFMDCQQPDMTEYLNHIPSPAADIHSALTVVNFYKTISTYTLFGGHDDVQQAVAS